MKQATGNRRKLSFAEVQEFARKSPMRAVHLKLYQVDYARGIMDIGKDAGCFWLMDGHRVDVVLTPDKGWSYSLSLEPDQDRPDPLE